MLPQPRPGRGAARKRGELLAATEKELAPIAAATGRDKHPLRGQDKIALRVGKVINHYNIANTFPSRSPTVLHVHPQHRSHRRRGRPQQDLVLRTSLPTDILTESEAVACYKHLADVERFFRTLNTELDIRPIRHRLADRCAPTCSCACCRTTSAGT